MFSRNERHLRSLFISKFYYNHNSHILRWGSIQLVATGPTVGYSLLLILFFLLLGSMPVIALQKQNKDRNRTSLKVLLKQGLSSQTAIFEFFSRCVTLYFPNSEIRGQFDKGRDLCAFGPKGVRLGLQGQLYLFFELEFIVNFASAFLRHVTRKWLLVFYFGTSIGAKSSYSRQTAIRALFVNP